MAERTEALAAATWPVAAALLQFPGRSERGVPITEESPEVWGRLLTRVRDAGYRSVEIPSAWLRLGDLEPARLREFAAVVAELGLAVPGVSVVRESVVHPVHSERNLAFSHRTIDAAAALGVPVVCLGLHDELEPRQRDVQWFWTVPGAVIPSQARAQAVRAYRQLGEHARSVGVEISLEMYEDTPLGSGRDAVDLLDDIDVDAVGINPDIGNLIRRQGPIDDWRETLALTLPRTNYWHVKNYLRLEDPATGTVLTHPCALRDGIADYRSAVRDALRSGFRGAFVVEHYGGDGLGVGAANEHYLRGLLRSAIEEIAAERQAEEERA